MIVLKSLVTKRIVTSFCRRGCTSTDCPWTVLDGTGEVVNWSNHNLKCYSLCYLWSMCTPSTQLHPRTLVCTSAPCTRSLRGQTWRTSHHFGSKLCRILITGSYEELHCSVTSSNLHHTKLFMAIFTSESYLAPKKRVFSVQPFWEK